MGVPAVASVPLRDRFLACPRFITQRGGKGGEGANVDLFDLLLTSFVVVVHSTTSANSATSTAKESSFFLPVELGRECCILTEGRATKKSRRRGGKEYGLCKKKEEGSFSPPR